MASREQDLQGQTKAWEHFPAAVYRDREERNAFVAREFAPQLQTSVLNVGGGGKKYLARWLAETVRYVEVDVAGEPDLIVDLERELPLPFEPQSFDTVVCTDVLEHVDNLHAVFAEVCRVSRRHVVISLPNAWSSFKGQVVRGTGHADKYYGLPLDAPEDRHKWFFSFTEAEQFLDVAGRRNGFRPARWLTCGYAHERFSRRAMRQTCGLVLGQRARFNLFATTIWVLLERDTGRSTA